MKPLLLLLLVPSLAQASWFEFESGVGISYTKDMGDGTWVQKDVPHSESLISPVKIIGITGDITSNLSWHADYLYSATVKASCTCVADSNYNPKTHTASTKGTIPFVGQGHTQGVLLTLEPHFTRYGLRFGVEAGPWFYWSTWHEARHDPLYPAEVDLSHVTRPQVGATAGLSIGWSNMRIVYRYFYQRQSWNPYPALSTGMHMVTFEKQF